jgi:hypothetical protein
MKIINLDHGFGNQVFQYVFFRYIQEHSNGDICLLDDRWGFANEANGYYKDSLEQAFGLKPPKLSDYFEPGAFKEIVRLTESEKIISLPDLLRRVGIDFAIVSEGKKFFYETRHNTIIPDYGEKYIEIAYNDYEFYSNVSAKPENIYFCGYWIDGHFFQKILLDELVFTPFRDKYNQVLLDEIASSNSVAVHFRPYIEAKEENLYWDVWTLPSAYFRYAINEMRHKVEKPTFFLFTNSLKLAREKFCEIGFTHKDNIILCDGNRNQGGDFRDVQLMSLCKHIITANSSFSLTAALLNKNPNKLIIMPNNAVNTTVK